MSIEVEATYEDGVLKLDKPLPLNEHERVTIEIKPKMSLSRRRAGSIRWTGTHEDLVKIAEDPESGILESS